MSAIREILVVVRIALNGWVGIVVAEAFICGVAATLSVTMTIWSTWPKWVPVVEALLSVLFIGLIVRTLTAVARRDIGRNTQKEVVKDLMRGAELHDREQQDLANDRDE